MSCWTRPGGPPSSLPLGGGGSGWGGRAWRQRCDALRCRARPTAPATFSQGMRHAILGAGGVGLLLNGVDHVDRLRRAFGWQVIAGAIRVESEKVGAGHVVQASPFASTDFGPEPALRGRAEALADEMRGAGLPCTVRDGEAEVLW